MGLKKEGGTVGQRDLLHHVPLSLCGVGREVQKVFKSWHQGLCLSCATSLSSSAALRDPHKDGDGHNLGTKLRASEGGW